ncbi:MAG: transglutaminase family protein [Beijerinckiaceae bacterium]
MTILTVEHVTTYRYRNAVRLGEHRMMVRPRDSFDQRLLGESLIIEPKPQRLRWILDVFSNCVAIAAFDGETRDLRIESRIELDHTPSSGPEFELDERARTYPFTYDFEEVPDLSRAIERLYRDHNGEIDAWTRQFLRKDRPTDTAQMLMTMTNAIRESFSYERRDEPGVQSPAHTLARRKGSCRDYAVLMMEAARSLGLAARFVSGYLYVPDRDKDHYLGGGSTHAWCQIYLPGAGWVEFDPTNGIVGSRDLIRVAVARTPSQAVPISGTYFGRRDDEEGMQVTVKVTSARAVGPDPAQHLQEIPRWPEPDAGGLR